MRTASQMQGPFSELNEEPCGASVESREWHVSRRVPNGNLGVPGWGVRIFYAEDMCRGYHAGAPFVNLKMETRGLAKFGRSQLFLDAHQMVGAWI